MTTKTRKSTSKKTKARNIEESAYATFSLCKECHGLVFELQDDNEVTYARLHIPGDPLEALDNITDLVVAEVERRYKEATDDDKTMLPAPTSATVH